MERIRRVLCWLRCDVGLRATLRAIRGLPTERDLPESDFPPTLENAVQYAAWWTLMALELARDEPDAHPGIIGHLKAARAQHDATERLLVASDTSDT
jgi:hypothetical protein